MLQDVLSKLTGHEMNAVFEVLNAVAPKNVWDADSTVLLKNLQSKLSQEKLKERSEKLMRRLRIKYNHLTNDEINYLCRRHCINFATLDAKDLPN